MRVLIVDDESLARVRLATLLEEIDAAKEAGATFAAYSMVRLPGAVAGIFENWLGRHFPDRKEKILNRIRASHGGALNESTPGQRMRGSGEAAGQLRALHHATCRRLGLATRPPELNVAAFRRVLPGQAELF